MSKKYSFTDPVNGKDEYIPADYSGLPVSIAMSNKTDDQLISLFHSNNWAGLDKESRLAACQELENRLAAMDNIAPRAISDELIDGKCYGYQQGEKIAVNASMLEKGTFCIYELDSNGNIVFDEQGKPTIYSSHEVPAASWNTFNTVVHEHTHGFSFDKGTQPYTYFSDDYDLYRIQTEEKVAYAKADYLTLMAMERVEQLTGQKDPSRAELISSLSQDSFKTSLEKAQDKYNDPDIENTLNQFISDNDKGIARDNPSPSYIAISNEYYNQCIKQTNDYLQENKNAQEIVPAQNHTDHKESTLSVSNENASEQTTKNENGSKTDTIQNVEKNDNNLVNDTTQNNTSSVNNTQEQTYNVPQTFESTENNSPSDNINDNGQHFSTNNENGTDNPNIITSSEENSPVNESSGITNVYQDGVVNLDNDSEVVYMDEDDGFSFGNESPSINMDDDGGFSFGNESPSIDMDNDGGFSFDNESPSIDMDNDGGFSFDEDYDNDNDGGDQGSGNDNDQDYD